MRSFLRASSQVAPAAPRDGIELRTRPLRNRQLVSPAAAVIQADQPDPAATRAAVRLFLQARPVPVAAPADFEAVRLGAIERGARLDRDLVRVLPDGTPPLLWSHMCDLRGSVMIRKS